MKISCPSQLNGTFLKEGDIVSLRDEISDAYDNKDSHKLQSVERLCSTLSLLLQVQLFIECRKAKTKVVTVANRKVHRQADEPITA